MKAASQFVDATGAVLRNYIHEMYHMFGISLV